MAAKKKAAKKKAAKKAPAKKRAAKKAKPKKGTTLVTMQETQAGPNVLRLMGRSYEVETAEAERMLAAGICTEG